MQTRYKYFALAFMMLFSALAVQAQTQRQWIEAAEQAYDYGDYANAAYYYGEALEYDTTDQELRFRLGESNLHYRAYRHALEDFALIERDGAAASFPRMPYLQGKAEQPLGNYDEAIAHFNQFLSNPGDASADEVEDAERQLNNAKWAKGVVALYEEEKAAGTQSNAFLIHYTDVNTRYDDFAPFFEADQFYFSSLRYRMDKDSIKPTRKIARILQRNAEGEEAINRKLPETINQRNRTAAHTAFNEAGTVAYFTYCEYLSDTLSLRCDIYSAPVNANGDWGMPRKLSINAAGANNTHPNVGMHPDGSEYLYFASDRSGGMGMHDLYRAPIEEGGTLGSVEALTELNTPYDDVTPYYYAPQRELYFSTDGRNTLGGLDIYRSSLNGDKWMDAVHMGIPTNTSYNDVYYTRFEGHDFGYFASNRYTADAIFWDEDKDVCCNDIYKVEVEMICLEVTTWHALTKAALNATTVTFYEEFPNGELLEIATETHAEDNLYTFEVEKGRKYRVKAVKRGFKGDEEVFEAKLPTVQDQGTEMACIKQELYLPPPQINLEVYTFNKKDSTALNGCTVAVTGFDDRTDETGNFYSYIIELEKYYDIHGSKEDYSSDSTNADTRGLFVENDTTLIRNLYLDPLMPDICDIQPTVFFHNDRPIKASPHTLTGANYMDTYNTYVGSHKPKYYSWATSNGVRDLIMDESFKLVDQGSEDLKAFAEMLEDYLSKGGSLTVSLQGFASPLSNGPYNDKLSARRCISVINYLYAYNGGALRPYLGDAVILINNKGGEEAQRRGIRTHAVPASYKGMPVVAYQGETAPAQEGKALVFDIKPGGEVPVNPSAGLVDSGPASIYHPTAIASRYVEVKVENCQYDEGDNAAAQE